MAEFDPRTIDNLYGVSPEYGLNTVAPKSTQNADYGNLYGAGPEYGLNSATQAPQEEKPWYHSLFHGGGSSEMTPKELNQYQAIQNGLANEKDQQIIDQLTKQKQDLLAGTQDRGGLFGQIGRIATGQGSNGLENGLTMAGSFAIPLLKAYLQQRAYKNLSNKVRDQYQQNRAMMQNDVNNILNR